MEDPLALVARLTALELPRAADRPPTLLLGETGTGKDLVARLLHDRSRLPGPFVDVNCASLPGPLVEAELFGYERGAFTDARAAKPGLFEAAEGGTLFLNEVGELPHGVQAKLLSALEQRSVRRVGGIRAREVDVWVMAATSRDLDGEAAAGRFRRDLLFRLNLVALRLPPLRARREDIRPLASVFAAKAAAKYRVPDRPFAAEALAALEAYPWPGNVRELAHVVERAVLVAHGPALGLGELALPAPPPRVAIRGRDDVEVDLPATGIDLEQVERRILEAALAQTGGNVSAAARRLGIGREALRYRIQKFGLAARDGDAG
jgi:DNA-binding NtrC family response regulator